MFSSTPFAMDTTVLRLAEEMAKAQLREYQPDHANPLDYGSAQFSHDSWAAHGHNQTQYTNLVNLQFSPVADSWASQAESQYLQSITTDAAPPLTTWGQLARISPDPFPKLLPQPSTWSHQERTPQYTPDFNVAKHTTSVLYEPVSLPTQSQSSPSSGYQISTWTGWSGCSTKSSPTSSDDRSRNCSSSDESLDSVESELRDIVMQGARIPVPPDGYVCHSCYTKGHYIQYCPKALQRADTVALTPYQGPKACIGHFCCTRCHHPWVSHRSFSNTPEMCKKCKIEVYPHKQERPYETTSVLVYFPRSSNRQPPPPGSRPIRGRVY